MNQVQRVLDSIKYKFLVAVGKYKDKSFTRTVNGKTHDLYLNKVH